MKEKKDPKALTATLLTVPISIVGAMSAVPAQAAEQNLAEDKKPGQQEPLAMRKTSGVAGSSAALSNTQQSHTVQDGETAESIARKFKLSVKQLMQMNQLHDPKSIFVGQKLKLIDDVVTSPSQARADAAKIHRIRQGETIASISKKYGVPVRTILAVNKLSEKALIFPGQSLAIGSVIPKLKTQGESVHVVQAGETLARIAKVYGVTVEDLKLANRLTSSSLLYVGQKLNLRKSGVVLEAAEAENSKAAGKNAPAATLSGGLSSEDPRRPSNVCAIHGFHTVKSGESASKIAAIYAQPTQSILSANNLGWTSMIFIGQRLVIPGVHEIKYCPDLTPLTAEMKSNAEIIYRVGKDLSVSDFGIVIALATAMQESGIRNLNYGDRDSVGLFQQRPSAHWGSAQQILNPTYASRAFFGGKTSPTYGAARGLLDIKNWATMSLTQAAQAVQISAFPNAYAKWELSAWVWFDEIDNAQKKKTPSA